MTGVSKYSYRNLFVGRSFLTTMKITLLLAALSITIFSFGQSKEETVNKINLLYAEHVALTKTTNLFKYDESRKVLEFGWVEIPLGNVIIEHTLELDEPNKHFVNFYMQKGTAATDKNDPSFKKAHFRLPFNSGKDAKKFVKLVEELKS